MDHTSREPILTPQSTYWRKASADRCSVIIDAQQYFIAVKEAVLQATHCVFFIGWDFDLHVRFEPGRQTLPGPKDLFSLIRWLEKNRPNVSIFILKWDLGIVFELTRGAIPLAAYRWITGKSVDIRLDSAHPTDSAQHQKLVVIDDVLAFCGGIDITEGRWDTRDHQDNDQRRRRSNGRRYEPWHDATTAVDGSVARVLGELARLRWRHATGQDVPMAPPSEPIWPSNITPDFRHVDIAIARTVPPYGEVDGVREIEALYVAAFRRARHHIYCESQYFASRKIADEIIRVLADEDGPEIVIVNPLSGNGFLEAAAMDAARSRLLKMVKEADVHDRFRIYTPVTAQEQPIYVHAKVLIVDDVFLRVGSSNLNNRSMGFDVECDLAIEAESLEAPLVEQISAVLNDLLAEHLDVESEQIAGARRAHHGSLIKAIESLRSSGRSLVPYAPDEPSDIEHQIVDSELLDPERATSLGKRMLSFLRFRPEPFR